MNIGTRISGPRVKRVNVPVAALAAGFDSRSFLFLMQCFESRPFLNGERGRTAQRIDQAILQCNAEAAKAKALSGAFSSVKREL